MVTGQQRLYLVQDKTLVPVEKKPLWLQGYEGKTANESIGLLLAKVDGRDMPLAVGYHKVAVDIRDQIARTAIEESFLNRTDMTLEGVFCFPLPPDASLAGFGVWMGDELVEADLVEKQRDREACMTILPARRNPALWEQSAGNVFKARVFSIFPHSEKRITITYTQVLPLRDNGYRYQYPLQNETLRQHPLRELQIDVKISSAMPLRSVASPTHATRNSLAVHSAHMEFCAHEYTPTQDFEVTVEVEGRQADVRLIPYHLGEDGYFMTQVMPPVGGTSKPSEKSLAAGARESQVASVSRERNILPDSEPLELLVLADTSASIDAAARRLQAEFVAATLSCLTPKDRLNLAACDVDCRWVFRSPAPADTEHVERAREFSPRRGRSAGLIWNVQYRRP